MFAEHPLASRFKKRVKTENCIVYTERENRERIETARYIVMTIKDEKKEDPKKDVDIRRFSLTTDTDN